MERLRPKPADFALLLLALVVVVAVVYTAKHSSSMQSSGEARAAPATTTRPAAPVPAPIATEPPSPAPIRPPTIRKRVVLVGVDLSDRAVVATVMSKLGTPVVAAQPDPAAPVPLQVFVDLQSGPSVVVLQLSRSAASRNDIRGVVTAIRSRAPGTQVVLVGPVRSGQSYGARLRALAKVVPGTYLDPIGERWVTPPTRTPPTGVQRQQMAVRLAQDLAPLLS